MFMVTHYKFCSLLFICILNPSPPSSTSMWFHCLLSLPYVVKASRQCVFYMFQNIFFMYLSVFSTLDLETSFELNSPFGKGLFAHEIEHHLFLTLFVCNPTFFPSLYTQDSFMLAKSLKHINWQEISKIPPLACLAPSNVKVNEEAFTMPSQYFSFTMSLDINTFILSYLEECTMP